MTWYVSSVSRRFMNDLLPSTNDKHETKLTGAQSALAAKFEDWVSSVEVDPCQNHIELKRLVDRARRVRGGNGGE